LSVALPRTRCGHLRKPHVAAKGSGVALRG
jgi:hypothetical protein